VDFGAPPNPRHKFEALQEAVESDTFSSDDPVLFAMASVLRGDTSVPADVLYAYSIFKNHYKRSILEAFILARARAEEIESVLSIRTDVVRIYTHVFFDPDEFKDRLDLEAYVRSYPDDPSGDTFGREVMTAAVEMGIHYLSATFARTDYEVPPDAALKELIGQSYRFSKVPFGSRLDSDFTKEARQWSSTLIGAIRTLPDVLESNQSHREELKIRLEMVNSTASKGEINDDDIIHPDEGSTP